MISLMSNRRCSISVRDTCEVSSALSSSAAPFSDSESELEEESLDCASYGVLLPLRISETVLQKSAQTKVVMTRT